MAVGMKNKGLVFYFLELNKQSIELQPNIRYSNCDFSFNSNTNFNCNSKLFN